MINTEALEVLHISYATNRLKLGTGALPAHESMLPKDKWLNEISNTLAVLRSHLLLQGILLGTDDDWEAFINEFQTKIEHHGIIPPGDWQVSLDKIKASLVASLALAEAMTEESRETIQGMTIREACNELSGQTGDLQMRKSHRDDYIWKQLISDTLAALADEAERGVLQRDPEGFKQLRQVLLARCSRLGIVLFDNKIWKKQLDLIENPKTKTEI